MLGHFRQVSSGLLERMKAKPALVERVMRYRPEGALLQGDAEAFVGLLPGHMRKMLDGMPPEMRAAFLAQVSRSVADMPDVLKDQIAAAQRPRGGKRAATAIDPADVGVELDIEKAWHGVHFLLCGSADRASGPFGSAVLGGKAIGPDHGYGPARYLEPPEVQAVAAALATLTSTAVVERFDPEALDRNGIYPGRWTAGGEQGDWLGDAFAQLQAFYADAAEKGWVVLMYIV